MSKTPTLDSLKESVELLIIIELDNSGRVKFVNDNYSSIFNSETEINFSERLHEKDLEKYQTEFTNCIENKSQSNDISLRVKTATGYSAILWRFVYRYNSHGEVRIQGIGFDIDSLVASFDQSRRVAIESVLEKDRLTSIMSQVAHDMRSPIATLKGYINLYENAKNEGLNKDTLRDLVNNLDEKVKKLSSAYKFNLDRSEFERFSIGEIVFSTLEENITSVLRSKVLLEVDILVEEIFSYKPFFKNLISRLMKACSEVLQDNDSLKIHVSTLEVGQNVELNLRFTGIKVDFEHLSEFALNPHSNLNAQKNNELALCLYISNKQINQVGGVFSLEKVGNIGFFTRITIPNS